MPIGIQLGVRSGEFTNTTAAYPDYPLPARDLNIVVRRQEEDARVAEGRSA